ncbi:MAG: serine hydrolase [Bacteroidales bacterium]|nr:serine hydrolase [Bacteroidales bacterium]
MNFRTTLKASLAAILFILLIANSQAQRFNQHFFFNSEGWQHVDGERDWVDSVLATLDFRSRIAQLMIVRVPTKMSASQENTFVREVAQKHIGGVCFFASTSERHACLVNKLRQIQSPPLLTCIDGEWGIGMRIKDIYSFPRNACFGALPSDADSLIFLMGQEVGLQCRMMGIDVNFAPVMDINSNPRNPVIGTRAYGSTADVVARCGTLFAKGMQQQGVMAVAKHFPGHGDTDADSHLELPVINHSVAYIDSVDLSPFRAAIASDVAAIMVAHIQVNAIDPQHPASLSKKVVDTLLRQQMQYDGFVFTDGLDMKGVTNTYNNGQGELAALLAGNDFLLLPPDIDKAITAIEQAAKSDPSIVALVNSHCRRVLQAKYRWTLPHIKSPIVIPDSARISAAQDITTMMRLNTCSAIDSIIGQAISQKAMPGGQLVVMHHGKMMLNKCYGRQTYDSLSDAVNQQTIYDLASLTKVLSTTLALMKLYDEGRIALDDPISRHLPYLQSTNKRRITIRQAMSHCAGLKAFDSYWKQANGHDSIMQLVVASPLMPGHSMVYSDLGFMLLADMVEYIVQQPINEYVASQFYRPMHLANTTFQPTANGIPLSRIAPTEVDSARGGIVHGHVHDPNAYAMGGVAGHAGLFSNATDVAQIMQMLLDRGVYKGHRYIAATTVDTFTSRHYVKQGNRRALGFDKPLLTPQANSQTAEEASQQSYGHTGFTGTMVWNDPQYDLVFVFLSNRVHPTATPNKLARMNIRTLVQSEIYNIISQKLNK